MADFTATFESGVNTATITNGAGEASATAWTTVTNTPIYDNTHVAHGTLAAKLASTTDALRWDTPLNPTDHYGRIYFYATALPPARRFIVNVGGGGADAVAQVAIEDDGRFHVEAFAASAEATSTATITLNQWIRFEYHVVHSGTVGQVTCRYFADPSSSTPTEEISTPATGNTAPSAQFIQFQNILYGSAFWIDDIVANATTWPGPVPVAAAQQLQPLRGGTGLW